MKLKLGLIFLILLILLSVADVSAADFNSMDITSFDDNSDSLALNDDGSLSQESYFAVSQEGDSQESDSLFSSGQDNIALSSEDSNEIDANNLSNIKTAGSSIIVSESNYSSYFNSNGIMKSSIIKDSTVYLAGVFSNKTFTFTVPVSITSYDSSTVLLDCIINFTDMNNMSDGSSHARIYGLKINNSMANAYQRPCILINEFDYVLVYNNTLFNTGISSYGIYNYYSNHCNITGNKVQTRVGQGGCYQHAGICLTGSDYCYIASNDVSVEDSNAIYLSSYNGGVSNNNIIFNNTVRCTLSSENPSVTGLIQPSAWNYLIHVMGDDNVITNNTILDGYVGIYCEGGYCNISGNYISGLHGSYYEGSSGNLGGEAGIFSKEHSHIANNTIVNSSIMQGINGGIQVGDYSIVENNHVEIINNGSSLYISSYCVIRNNTLLSQGSGINSSRLNNYGNTIADNLIMAGTYNIKITASDNLIVNNTIVNYDNASKSKNAAIYLYNKKAMDSNRIINNTIITNTSYSIYLQGNASNTLIKGNKITSNNSNPIISLRYGSTSSNDVSPSNTILEDNIFDIPINEINITDSNYYDYFDDEGYLIEGVIDFNDEIPDYIIIINTSNKNFVFDNNVTVDGKGMGSIVNGTISLSSQASGSVISNIIFNYTHTGYDALNLIKVEKGASKISLDNNIINIISNSESFASIKAISLDSSEDVEISNNQINIESLDSIVYGIYSLEDRNLSILNNHISINSYNTGRGIYLSKVNNSNVKNNNIVSNSIGDASNSYAVEAYNLNNISFSGNFINSTSRVQSYGLSIFRGAGLSIDSNEIHLCATGALAIDLYGDDDSPASNINMIENNLIDVLGGDYSLIDIFTHKGNAAIFISDNASASISKNIFTVSGEDPINVTAAKYLDIGANSFVINDNNIYKLFDLENLFLRIKENSDIKDGDELLFDLKDGYGLTFVFDNSLNIKSYSTVKNMSFVFNSGASNSNLSDMDFISSSSDYLILLNKSNGITLTNLNIQIKDIEDDYVAAVGLIESNNCVLTKNRISVSLHDSLNYYGIMVLNSNNSLISENDINIEVSNGALEFSNLSGILLNQSLNTSICKNDFDLNGEMVFAIDISNSSRNIISGNTIDSIGNLIVLIRTDNCLNSSVMDNVLRADADVSYGFIAFNSSYNQLDSNYIRLYGNDISSFKIAEIPSQEGIYFAGNSSNIEVSNNYIISTYESGGDYGIYLDLYGDVMDISISDNYIICDNGETKGNAAVYINPVFENMVDISSNTPQSTRKSSCFEYSNNLTLSFDNQSSLLKVFNIFLKDSNGNKLPNRSVQFKLYDETYLVNTDDDGMASLEVFLYGNATLGFSFLGDDRYLGSMGFIRINALDVSPVIRNATEFEFSNLSAISKIIFEDGSETTGCYFNLTLKDVNGNNLADKTVEFYFEGKTYSVKTNGEGVAQVAIEFSNPYTGYISFAFEGDAYYNGTSGIAFIKTAKKNSYIQCSNMTTTCIVSSRSGEYFTARLLDDDGNPLVNRSIQIGFNGKVYERTSNETGGFRLQVNLGYQGGYTFAISFLGDDEYYGSFAVSKITVVKNNVSLTTPTTKIKASSSSKYIYITLLTSKGKPLSGKTISLTLNSKTYSAKTDSNGVAMVKISISAKKTYTYAVKFAGDSSCNAKSQNGKLTIY